MQTPLSKVSCKYLCLQFCANRSRNIGGCFVMSAVHWRLLLLRHCLEGAETVFLEGNEQTTSSTLLAYAWIIVTGLFLSGVCESASFWVKHDASTLSRLLVDGWCITGPLLCRAFASVTKKRVTERQVETIRAFSKECYAYRLFSLSIHKLGCAQFLLLICKDCSQQQEADIERYGKI